MTDNPMTKRKTTKREMIIYKTLSRPSIGTSYITLLARVSFYLWLFNKGWNEMVTSSLDLLPKKNKCAIDQISFFYRGCRTRDQQTTKHI